MKIAIVTYSIMMGGIETVIFNQAKYFINEGHEVTVFETLRKGAWVNYFLQNDIRVKSILPSSLFSKKWHVKKIAQALKDYEVVLLHDAPYAQSILGLLPEETVCIPILHSSPESMIKNSVGNIGQWNRIAFVSPYLKELLLKTGKVKDQFIINIPNGINIPNEIPESINTHRKGKKFVFIGRIEHQEKAVLFIPDIIKHVMLSREIEVLNIYGTGSSEEELMQKIEELSLGEIIKLNGALEHKNVNAILQQHDFMLMPSFFEGHPIVLLEAMACKTIPFVSDLKGRTDFVVEHEVNGFLCKAADIEDFSNKIIEGMDREDLLEIAERGRITIIEKFSIDTMGKSYMDLILREKSIKRISKRTNSIFLELLGDLPSLPIILIRPVRKTLRILNLWH